jgi:mitotic spindle assembly checkpoint protein MAD1
MPRPLLLLTLFIQFIQASFTAEETSQDRIDSDTTPLLNSIEAQRIQQLETLLAEYKATVDSLTKEMAAIGGGDPLSLGSGRSRKELAEEAEMERAAKVEIQKGTIIFYYHLTIIQLTSLLALALSETEAASGKQLEKIEELEQTLFELQGEIGAGNHIPPGVRVLSLKQNPAQEWSDLRQAVMDRLKGENEALIKRLKELEEGGHRAGEGVGDDLVPRQSWEVVNKEKTELEEVVKQKEKRLLRLQQVRLSFFSLSVLD